VLNDRIADGRDVSWVWDADWELLVGSVRRFTASGTRAAELALRMKYAGLDADRITIVDDVEQGLDSALRSGDGPLYVIPTYTALLELREILTRRGQAEAYWR
jgi:UDP-N-acetylmuramyl tripeptide synthase